MTEKTDFGVLSENPASELRQAFDCLDRIVLDGLRHGHFRFEIKGTVGKNLRRELVIEAGVSHKFKVHMDDLKR